MVFSSVIFLFFFFPLVLGVYFLSPNIKVKNIVLLISSLFFYAWGEAELVILMILSSLFNYGIGLWVNAKRSSILPVFIGVSVNILTLIYFKYVSLIAGSIDAVIGTQLNDGINIHLPIGISFFTFQSISYIVDVQRGTAKVQRNPLSLMLYISLFPQLIAGPIVRYTQVERALYFREHSVAEFVAGAKRFCLGLAKKVLIANVVGEIADEIFALPQDNLYFSLSWFAIMAYALHIYFDFSGYSDMAIGLGRMFGFKFPENFNYPYISRSIQEFWRRWHISLSSWFRDYLYIPLGGNRKGSSRTYFNLFVVFFITGMWHGGTWNFVLWGLLHGLFLIIERLGFVKFLKRVPVLGHVYCLLVVLFAWVLFRIPDLRDAIVFYKSMFKSSAEVAGNSLSDLLDGEYLFIFFLGVCLSAPIRPLILKLKSRIDNKWMLETWSFSTSLFYLALLALSAMAISSSTYNPFIYFRF
ncbi:MAG: MBOAT family protein [Flavobacteriales bacterium]|nr:MBOAT family protein [Flavobacteriales bacterium]